MISIKPGVSLRGICPEIAVAIAVMNSQMAGEDLVITCGTDGKHRTGSLHYIGHAVDIRRIGLKDAEATAEKFRKALGDDFDVIVEATHLHVEFQPASPLNLK